MARRLALIFTMITFIILSGEAACRVKYYMFHKDIQYLVAPFSKKKKTEQTGPVIINATGRDSLIYSPCQDTILPQSYNEFGWRYSGLQLNKRTKTLRIMCVGASTVRCDGIPDSDTWCKVLEDKLNSDPQVAIPVQVINTGISKFYAKDILLMLHNKGYAFKPDLIVYYLAYGEIYEGKSFSKVDTDIGRLLQGPYKRIHKVLHYNSMLYTYLVEKYSFRKWDNRFSLKDLESLTQDFRLLIDDVENHGVEFVYVKEALNYPSRWQGRNLNNKDAFLVLHDQKDRLNNTEMTEEEKLLFNKYSLYAKLINELQTEKARDRNIIIIDPSSVINYESHLKQNLFLDRVHLNCRGNYLLADIIYQGIRQMVVNKIDHLH